MKNLMMLSNKFFIVLMVWICSFSSSLLYGDWSPPMNLSSVGDQSNTPSIAVDPNGNAVAVWESFTGSVVDIQGSTLAAGSSTWVRTTDLSIPGHSNLFSEVKMDAHGNAIAIWQDGPSGLFKSARLPLGSTTWIPLGDIPITFTLFSGRSFAVDPSGNAVVVLSVANGGPPEKIVAATLAAGSSTWVVTSQVSPPGGDAFDVQVVMSGSGTAIAIFSQGVTTVIKSAMLALGSTTWVPLPITSTHDAVSPQIAVNGAGDAVASWLSIRGFFSVLEGATLAAGSSSWVSTAILPMSEDASPAVVGIDFDGNAIATYLNVSGGVQGARLQFGSLIWTPTDNLTQPGQMSNQVTLAVNPIGNAVALWSLFDGSNNLAAASTLFPGSNTWSPSTVISQTGANAFDLSVALSASNRAIAAWDRFDSDSSTNFIQATENQLVPPVSPSLSTVVADPTTVAADGVSFSTITVTLIDSDGSPVVGKTVVLRPDKGKSRISPCSSVTDAQGQAFFKVRDHHVEKVTYTAQDIDDCVLISQTATVSFVVLPPLDFFGESKRNKVLEVDLLGWIPSPDKSVVAYRVYLNGKVVAETSADGPFFAKVIHQNPKGHYTYKLVAVNKQGNRSSPLFLTLPDNSSSSSSW